MGPLLQCADGSLVETGAQCPGFVPGNMSQSDQQQYEINALWQQLQMPPGGNNLPIDDGNHATGQTFTQWLNQNAGTVALAAGGFFFLALAVKR